LPADLLASARLRLEQPTPRVALGMALRGIATAAADVSDGLLGDLGHILKQSGVSATIDITVATNLIAACAHSTGASATNIFKLPAHQALQCVLSGGDDYELVFTAPRTARAAVQAAALASHTTVTCIGSVTSIDVGHAAGTRVHLIDADGAAMANTFASFDHFA
jgi:thiamine-monophosphate kinase